MKKEDLTIEMISNILEGADYGCNWKDIQFNSKSRDEKIKEASRKNISEYIAFGHCWSVVYARLLLGGETLTVHDCDEGVNHNLTINKLIKGLNVWLKQNNKIKYDENVDDYDYIDYDGIIQCALFGEVIFG